MSTSTSIIERTFNGLAFQQRPSDNWFNATAICRAFGKKFSNYSRTNGTSEYIHALARDKARTAGYPQLLPNQPLTQAYLDLVIESKVGGDHAGTWICEELSVDLARWCCPELAVEVSKWIVQIIKGNQSVVVAPSNPQDMQLVPALSDIIRNEVMPLHQEIVQLRSELATITPAIRTEVTAAVAPLEQQVRNNTFNIGNLNRITAWFHGQIDAMNALTSSKKKKFEYPF